MEHAERRRWCEQISKINRNMNVDDRQKNLGE
jgi:hypothetical protein